MRKSLLTLLPPLLAAPIIAGCFSRAQPIPTTPTSTTPRPGARGPAGPGIPPGRTDGVKPYSQVITSEAKTSSGMFKTHQVGEKLYFEIPAKELNRDMLLVGRFAKTSSQSGGNRGFIESYAGDAFSERVLRWQRQGNKIFLRAPSFEITADTSLPVYKAVSNSNNPAIIAIINVETYGPDSAAVIDVTRLYISGVPEFMSIRGNLDQSRSYIEQARAFPDNVEVEATQTIIAQNTNPSSSQRDSERPSAQTVVAHWSMVRLPDRPMQPRLSDNRVGYFSIEQTDFGTEEHRSLQRSFITRWRLEKKYPNAELSEPVKPIIYYIDPATPDKWKKWIKKGVEEWQVAFESAGFKNAIIAKDSPINDPNWSAEDVRNTIIRWLPSTTQNAQGPHVKDPRTGEILNGSIRVFHNILSLANNWYFVQAAPLDKRAQKLPLPDSLMGRLLQTIIAHEVGHTLGLSHNMKASSLYPLDSIRSRTWVRRMGHSPSIMDYARFNYVAQPEDNIPPEDLNPRVGPYDKFAIMWGYKPIANARTPTTPDQEKPTLNSWARMQDTIPWYRYSTQGTYGIDPGDQSEAVGDADAVRATELGIRNIKRIIPMLIPAATKEGESNQQLADLYEATVKQWRDEILHVVDIVGGMETWERYGGQPGPRFTPLPRERQREAVRFINENVFNTPMYLLDPTVLRRIEPDGALARVRSAQADVLNQLTLPSRLTRMVEFAALSQRPGTTYTVADLLSDIRTGVWTEIDQPSVRIDVFRRSLQSIYLQMFSIKLNPQFGPGVPSIFRGPALTPDAQAQMRGELMELDTRLQAAILKAADSATRLHLIDARAQIKKALNPDD